MFILKRLFLIGIAIAILVLLLIRIRYDRLVKQVWRSLKSQPSNAVFTQEMVAHLDEPVQRYFLHAIAPRTSLANYVELKMNGSFRLKPNAAWLDLKASQIISIMPGLIWKANIGNGLTSFCGADYYSKRQGRTKFSFWGLIPLVDAQSKDVDCEASRRHRSAAGRLGAEYIWLPSALLLHRGVDWKTISQDTIQANFSIDNESICLTLTIDRDGRLIELSLPRCGNATVDQSWQYSTFIADMSAEETFEGYTIPTNISAGWLDRNQYQIFFRSTVNRAEFG